MHEAHDFLRTLAVVLGVAAVTTVVFQRLKQPVVFGYLLAGIIIGPYLPIPIAADAATVRTLAELGVILLLFGLGLEFSIRKLITTGPTAGVVAVAQSALMVWIGFLLGRAFGWTTLERFYAGAIIAISSTTIIAKAFEEQRVTGKFRELVLGVLIIEDLIGIFLIAILTTVSSGADISASTLASTGLQLALFLAALIGVGLLIVPRVVRFIVRMDRPETTLIASIGICFIAALLALSFDYSVALGAFIAGSLIAESGHERLIEHLVQPVRDVFAAIFFVSVGMLINPALVAEHWVAVLAFTAAVILGKVVAVAIGAFAVGFSPRTAVQAGMSLAQIGEFSFIIAGVGLATGATRDFLYPIAVAVSAITTLSTPWLIRSSGKTASYVDRSLPRPLQTFVSLYGSWMDRLRGARTGGRSRSRSRRLTGLLLLDAAMIIAVIIGTSFELAVFSKVVGEWTSLTPQMSRLVVLIVAAVVLAPLLVGLVRTAGQLAVALALAALPAPAKGVDFAASPRRALVVTLQLALVLALGIAIALMTQPFVPAFRSVLTTGVGLAAFIVIAGVSLWRTANDLHGHAKAGAEIIVSALAGQMATPSDGKTTDPDRALHRLHDMLPGLGDPSPLRIESGSSADGRTLAEVDLRGQTGAAVLAIIRDGQPVLMPGGTEVLRVGDVLAVVGSREAIDDTRLLLAPK
jgi:CPA2 family monovalent cation:H+ antiporter-2